MRSPGKLTARGNKRMETGRKGTGCYCGKLRTVVFLGLKLVVSAAHDTAHKINQEKKGQSQNTLRDVDKEQGKRNKRSKQALNKGGLGSSLPTLWGIWVTDFYKTKVKEKRNEMYICKLKSKKTNSNVKVFGLPWTQQQSVWGHLISYLFKLYRMSK